MVTTSMARTVSKVAQTAVGDGADAAGAAAEKSADRGLDHGRGIAAQLPAWLARFAFEHAEAQAGLANGDAIGGDLLRCLSMRARSSTMPPWSGTAWP